MPLSTSFRPINIFKLCIITGFGLGIYMCSSLSPKSPVVLIHQVVGWGQVRVSTRLGYLGASMVCSEFRWRLRLC